VNVKGGLNRKLGPLKLWHWILIGVVLGVGVYYFRNKEENAPTEGAYGGTGTGAFGPINPESGIPYAFEGGAGAAGETLPTFLEKVKELKDSGLLGPEVVTEPGEVIELPGPSEDLLNFLLVRDKQQRAALKAARKARQQAKKQRHGKGAGGHKAGANKQGSKGAKKGKGKGKTPRSTGAAAHAPASHHARPHPASRPSAHPPPHYHPPKQKQHKQPKPKAHH
jgi:hypothetical protein